MKAIASGESVCGLYWLSNHEKAQMAACQVKQASSSTSAFHQTVRVENGCQCLLEASWRSLAAVPDVSNLSKMPAPHMQSQAKLLSAMLGSPGCSLMQCTCDEGPEEVTAEQHDRRREVPQPLPC